MRSPGPQPIGLRRNRRRWPLALARAGAVALLLLVLLHLLFLALAGLSLPWPQSIAALRGLLPEEAAAGGPLVAWLFVLPALACAAALWSVASRLAALLFLLVSLWEFRGWLRGLEQQAAEGAAGGSGLAYLGAMVAFIALCAAFLALLGALAADRSGGRLDGRFG